MLTEPRLCPQGDDAAPQWDPPEGDAVRRHRWAAVEGRRGPARRPRHSRGQPRVRGQRQVHHGRADREGE